MKPTLERKAEAASRCSAWLDRNLVIAKIKESQARYAALFVKTPWDEEQLSDVGWLCLMAVPWLLHEVENNRENQSGHGNANGNPRPDGVWLSKPTIQLVLTKDAHANAALVIPATNKLAHFFCRLLSKLKGVMVFHGVMSVMRSND